MKPDQRQPEAPIQFTVTKPWQLFAFGAALFSVRPGLFVPNQGHNVRALYSDTLRTLGRLEISDPSPPDPAVNPYPSPDALFLSSLIYSDGATLLMRTMEEEAARRRAAAQSLTTRQQALVVSGILFTVIFGTSVLMSLGLTWYFLTNYLFPHPSITGPFLVPGFVIAALFGGYYYFKLMAIHAAQVCVPEVYLPALDTTPLPADRTIVSAHTRVPSTLVADPHGTFTQRQ